MRRLNLYNPIGASVISALFAIILCWPSVVQAGRPGWQRQEVNWRMSGGSRIKAVRFPTDTPLLDRDSGRTHTISHENTFFAASATRTESQRNIAASAATQFDIISPPTAGFAPWIVVGITDARLGELELDAIPKTSVVGNYLTSNPQANYGIGLFDTGAAAHVLNWLDATTTGVFDHVPNLLTSSTIEVSGVTGTIPAWVSQPLGLFIDGLGSVDPNGLVSDDSMMVGQINVSVAVGDSIESPNVPTAIGTPLSVFFTSVIYNDRQITVARDGNELMAPDLRFYEHDDRHIPKYPNTIPLELRPSGAVAVQYFPNIFDPFDPDFGSPAAPSMIMGFLPTQSLFFISSVDLSDGDKQALDKDGFMLDTGAQVSVVSEAIGARLGLNADKADFEVEIQDVTGGTTIAPGFFIDSLEIVAMPRWLSYTNVPIVMLNVSSPEGGFLDGIVGMNLFVDFNLVIRGGGLAGLAPPAIEFERISSRIIADIAPQGGDGVVDFLDLAALANAWLMTADSPDWNPKVDIAPRPRPDNIINFTDFIVLAEHWHQTAPP